MRPLHQLRMGLSSIALKAFSPKIAPPERFCLRHGSKPLPRDTGEDPGDLSVSTEPADCLGGAVLEQGLEVGGDGGAEAFVGGEVLTEDLGDGEQAGG